MIALVVLFVICGLLMLALGIPLIRRRIPPNGLYGLRVPATFADEWVWYEANAHSGRDFVKLGIVQIVGALVLPAYPGITEEGYGLTMAAILTLGALAVAVVGWRRANRLLRRRRAAGGPE